MSVGSGSPGCLRRPSCSDWVGKQSLKPNLTWKENQKAGGWLSCPKPYLLPRAAITNDLTVVAETTEIFSLPVLEARSVRAEWGPVETEGDPSLLLSWLQAVIGSRWHCLAHRHIVPIAATIVMWPCPPGHLLCVCVSSVPLLSLIRTAVNGFRAQPKSRMLSPRDSLLSYIYRDPISK